MATGGTDKIQDIDALAKTLDQYRGTKKIVHCHGVFDLMHIGHIKHFQAAKQLGDVLVVTITPDQFVNKGPHRPVFTATLRAEAIASLESVDYVAINRWPMALEAIALIRPDLYVKGVEYRDAAKDHTGGIKLEQEAVEAVGGKLAFTDDIVYSSTSLVNQHFNTLPKEVTEYLEGFRSRWPIEDVLAPLQQSRPIKVLAVGETIIDEYQYCEAIGKSSKEPMLALRYVSTEKFAGGVLAVANHLASFSDNVSVVSQLGALNSQEEFVRENVSSKVDQHYLFRTDAPTIVKRRFVESYFFTKMIEVYEMNPSPLIAADDEALCAKLEELVPQFDMVLVFDFGHEMLTKRAIDILCSKAKFLAVNAQCNAANIGYHTVSVYPRADYVCIAENEMRIESRNRRGALEDIVEPVAKRLGAKWVITTRGKNGCLCYKAGSGFVSVPAFAGKVVDRMGAGDAFLSVTSLCVAQDAPPEIIGFIGNVVGAHAVATVGHRAAVQRASLFKHIESLLK